MRFRCFVLVILAWTGVFMGVACRSVRDTKTEFGAGITAEALKAHLEFLADDALEGRRTGTRGHDIAAKYMATEFAAMGLKGGMPDGSYFQKVPFRRTEVQPEGTSIVLSRGAKTATLKYSSDFLLLDTHQTAKSEISGPMVFAGYGVSAPELNYDDYAGLDVKGKIAVLLDWEAPSKFPSAVRGYYMDQAVKREIAAAHGALAIVGIRTPAIEKKFPWQFMQRELAIGWNSLRWLEPQGRVHGLDENSGPWTLLNRSGADALFAGEQYTLNEIFAALEKGEPLRFPLSKTATIAYESRHTAIEGANVVALLEGTDEALKREQVVFSTHFDHLGIGPAVDGDSIYNGANDNASGCATLLEIARAFSHLPKRPRRSMMFVAVTGEEQGLLGSGYFANNPPVPIGQIVADINFDGSIAFNPVRDVIAYGEIHSSLGRRAREAAAESGFDVSPDPFPDEGFFVRTDHYSFVRQGIPALAVDWGIQSSKPGVDVLKAMGEWMLTVYHSPKDDTSQKFDYDTGVKFARFAGLLGYKVAMDTARPRWNEGDFFGKRFGAAK